MTKKWFVLKCLVVVMLVLISVFIFLIILNKRMSDEQTLLNSYEINKEKSEMLKKIAKETIKENESIDIKKIPNEEVEYRIYNKDETIIYNYKLKCDSQYFATITLSNKYKILDEKYSINIDNIEEYIEYCNNEKKIYIIVFIVCVIGLVTNLLIKKIKYYRKREEIIKNNY